MENRKANLNFCSWCLKSPRLPFIGNPVYSKGLLISCRFFSRPNPIYRILRPSNQYYRFLFSLNRPVGSPTFQPVLLFAFSLNRSVGSLSFQPVLLFAFSLNRSQGFLSFQPVLLFAFSLNRPVGSLSFRPVL